MKLTQGHGNQWYGMLQLTTTHNFDNESTILKVKHLERKDKCKHTHIAKHIWTMRIHQSKPLLQTMIFWDGEILLFKI
jgi:hypothetical protein